jgi:hypothetical protein
MLCGIDTPGFMYVCQAKSLLLVIRVYTSWLFEIFAFGVDEGHSVASAQLYQVMMVVFLSCLVEVIHMVEGSAL